MVLYPAPLSSMIHTCGAEFAVAVPVTVKSNGVLVVSFETKLTGPANAPTVAGSKRTTKLVVCPGATVVVPKPADRLKPAGSVIVPSVRLAVPSLRTVTVLLTGAPTVVLPKATVLVPSTSDVPSTSTARDGTGTGAGPPTRSTRTASATR